MNFSGARVVVAETPKDEFRRKFQASLYQCSQYSLAIEECFGTIWLEILDEVRLSEDEEIEVYREMIEWAKGLMETRFAESSTALYLENANHFAEFATNSQSSVRA